ncbi:MAG: CDP-diacylglycerol--glycerol-3-phosphate 3-phosphatidyltransferase, partial [Gammaproteobacteria bacterium]
MSATLNLPNLLTWIRIILIPLIVLAFYLPHYWDAIPASWAGPSASIIFALAGITDWLD